MKICGLQKTTLLDYPGHVACTIFLGGCNLRCPFCHNRELLGQDAKALYTEEEILAFLKKRRPMLDGVCITGGEPTLQPDLEPLIRNIRQLGYRIKLDTNGCRPDVLKELCEKRLLDYAAMDIKSSIERYPVVTGLPAVPTDKIKESVELLMSDAVPYEFRTTVVKELHSADDFRDIGRWLAGCSRYYLQNYKESEQVLRPGFSSCSKEELLGFSRILEDYIEHVGLRGADY